MADVRLGLLGTGAGGDDNGGGARRKRREEDGLSDAYSSNSGRSLCTQRLHLPLWQLVLIAAVMFGIGCAMPALFGRTGNGGGVAGSKMAPLTNPTAGTNGAAAGGSGSTTATAECPVCPAAEAGECPTCPVCPKADSSAGECPTCPVCAVCPVQKACPAPVECPAPKPAPVCVPPPKPALLPVCKLWPCRNGGTCKAAVTEDDQWCDCPPGTDGKMCENDSRGPGATACAGGYQLRDGRCYDIDECKTNNYGGCHPMRPCINVNGSSQCAPCQPPMIPAGDGGCEWPCADRAALMQTKADTTFVTALYQTGRTDRDFGYYLNKLWRVLQAPVPIVLFASPATIAWARDMRANHSNPAAAAAPFLGVDFPRARLTTDYNIYSRSDPIRRSSEWIGQCSWAAGSVNSKELYNEITFFKSRWLRQAMELNPFGTGYFAWVDGGFRCAESEDWDSWQRWIPAQGDTIFGQHFHYDGYPEIHCYSRAVAEDFAHTHISWVLRATVFGGSKAIMTDFCDAFDELVDRSLKRKTLGTEEALMAIMEYTRPDMFRIRTEDPCRPMTACVPKGQHAIPMRPGTPPYVIDGDMPK